MTIASLLLLALAALMLLPSAVVALECFVGAVARDRELSGTTTAVRSVVIVPAHDEEAGIGATLSSLADELDADTELVVVADNCSDATAAIARAHGARVCERRDPLRRGKGYALTFARDALARTPPDIAVIVDADCKLTPGSLAKLIGAAHHSNRPIQADYVLEANDTSPRSRISAFAFIVRNRTRARALMTLGFPCPLTGTGMAMPWPLFDRIVATEGELVEDLLMGLELALLGYPPLYSASARVTSLRGIL